MDSEDKPKNKKRRPLRSMFAILLIAALAYVAIAYISGRQSEMLGAFDILSRLQAIEMADEFDFDIGRSRVFANIDKSIAAVGTLGIQVLRADGTELLRDSCRMTNPSICAQNGRAVAYDIGGTAIRIFSEKEIIASIEANGSINSVTINRNGWISVCTQDSQSYKGVATVYDKQGIPVYKVNMASGYILTAALSPDNSSLAVLGLAGEGSKVTVYSLDSEDVDRIFALPGELLLDIRYLSGGEVLAISTESLFLINKRNEMDTLFEFDQGRLGGFILNPDITILHIYDQNAGYRGRVLSIDKTGRIYGEAAIDREIVSMSMESGYLSIMLTDSALFFNSLMEQVPLAQELFLAAGATKILSLRKGTALLAGDHFAYSIKTA